MPSDRKEPDFVASDSLDPRDRIRHDPEALKRLHRIYVKAYENGIGTVNVNRDDLALCLAYAGWYLADGKR